MAFVQLLLEAAAQTTVPIYVVLTMRSDFLGDCAQFHGLPEAINEGQYLVPRLTGNEIRAAITGPVAVRMAASLRPGNVPSADDWDDLLMPEIHRQQGAGRRVAFRADAAFARPAIYEALEQRDVDYAIRMPANKTLELAIEDILFRPPGRPGCKPLVRYKSFRYQAKSWTTARRIVAKVAVSG